MINHSLSVIIPAYNEEVQIANLIDQLDSLLLSGLSCYEIIVVNDGSHDRTGDILDNLQKSYTNLRVLSHKNKQGKGRSVNDGFRLAKCDLVSFIDADLSIPVSTVMDLYKKRNDLGLNAVIASRFLSESVSLGVLRGIFSYGFRMTRLLIIGLSNIKDTQCGCKLFVRKDIAPFLDSLSVDGFCFDAELLYLMSQKGLKITEIPVTINKQVDRQSRVRLIRESWFMFCDLIKIKIKHG